MSDRTNILISQKVPQYIAKYKEYLITKLNDERQYMKLMEVYNVNKDQPNYGCIYCKEIINVLEVTGQFNCSFKVFKISQLKDFNIDISNNNETIKILAILSDESTMYMTEHFQYFFIINVNIMQRSFIIDDNYTPIKINEYDPIMSKSQQYNGSYRFDQNQKLEENMDSLCKSVILEKIDNDNMKSISTEVYNYYHDTYLHLNRPKKKEEIKRIFPFLCSSAINTLSRSLQKTRYFLYAKVTIEQSFHQYLMESFNYQDLSQLSSVFTRLTTEDFQLLGSCDSIEEQYECFRRLTEDTEKGLTYDEFLNMMIKKINENYVTGQLSDFQIALFSDDIEEEDDDIREEDWDW